MRRVSLLGLVFAAAVSCNGAGEGSDRGDVPQRVNAVRTHQATGGESEWCDVYHPPGRGPRLDMPKTVDARDGGAKGVEPTGEWTWINVWATWCGPCLREMPLISRWMDALRRDGRAVSLWYVSLDEDQAALSDYLRAHPQTARPRSLRVVDVESVPAWLSRMGLAPDTAIPVNVLVAPLGEVRCVRTGAINDGHYPAISAILGRENRGLSTGLNSQK